MSSRRRRHEQSSDHRQNQPPHHSISTTTSVRCRAISRNSRTAASLRLRRKAASTASRASSNGASPPSFRSSRCTVYLESPVPISIDSPGGHGNDRNVRRSGRAACSISFSSTNPSGSGTVRPLHANPIPRRAFETEALGFVECAELCFVSGARFVLRPAHEEVDHRGRELVADLRIALVKPEFDGAIDQELLIDQALEHPTAVALPKCSGFPVAGDCAERALVRLAGDRTPVHPSHGIFRGVRSVREARHVEHSHGCADQHTPGEQPRPTHGEVPARR